MFKLISMTDVLPRSLFITDITTLDVIGVGGFGRVFKGEWHEGQHVALKVVDKSHKSVCTSAFLSLNTIFMHLEAFSQERLLSGSFDVAINATPLYHPSAGNI